MLSRQCWGGFRPGKTLKKAVSQLLLTKVRFLTVTWCEKLTFLSAKCRVAKDWLRAIALT
ncbi:MAG: hypothetical protein IGR93_04160 [Hydrococcus sp. C42_A2020_068]|uniref:hypothetical protein n=1 Tax=Pleurocapsa sp. PCC 7327 TaxID=118163 RepID=UPI000317956C|nr:hypothetical protein [Pleurocapsa sp. PCC 7327]MBF2019319.1 hypothetical protein [Hydrococcus sp. C42_A2020_068]